MSGSYVADEVLCAILFEYLHKDFASSYELFKQALQLPWKQKDLQKLFDYYLIIIETTQSRPIQNNFVSPLIFRDFLQLALSHFPNHVKFLSSFIKNESRCQLQNRLRRFFDESCKKYIFF